MSTNAACMPGSTRVTRPFTTFADDALASCRARCGARRAGPSRGSRRGSRPALALIRISFCIPCPPAGRGRRGGAAEAEPASRGREPGWRARRAGRAWGQAGAPAPKGGRRRDGRSGESPEDRLLKLLTRNNVSSLHLAVRIRPPELREDPTARQRLGVSVPRLPEPPGLSGILPGSAGHPRGVHSAGPRRKTVTGTSWIAGAMVKVSRGSALEHRDPPRGIVPLLVDPLPRAPRAVDPDRSAACVRRGRPAGADARSRRPGKRRGARRGGRRSRRPRRARGAADARAPAPDPGRERDRRGAAHQPRARPAAPRARPPRSRAAAAGYSATSSSTSTAARAAIARRRRSRSLRAALGRRGGAGGEQQRRRGPARAVEPLRAAAR